MAKKFTDQELFLWIEEMAAELAQVSKQRSPELTVLFKLAADTANRLADEAEVAAKRRYPRQASETHVVSG